MLLSPKKLLTTAWTKTALSLSTLLGVIFAILIQAPAVLNNILISFIAGILILKS
jgi:hypothetical protein